jgi:intracellular septation protein A
MPNIPKIALSFVVAIIFFVLGKYLAVNLGSASRWLIILAVIAFYAIWWSHHRRTK